MPRKAAPSQCWIDRLEVTDFASYGGTQVIGPFRRFTAVIGPNGSGKSNSLDAICFVFGVPTPRDRGTKWRVTDLLHRDQKKRVATQASVRCFLKQDGSETCLERVIDSSGTSKYSIDGRKLTYESYAEKVKTDFGINVKARNFLVFQGEVEQLSARSPTALVELLEVASGSSDLRNTFNETKAAYEKARVAQTEWAARHRAVRADRLRVKEARKAAVRSAGVASDLDATRRAFVAFKLFAIERAIASVKTQRREFGEKVTALQTANAAHLSKHKQSQAKWSAAQKALVEAERRKAVAQRACDAAEAVRGVAMSKRSAIARRLAALKAAAKAAAASSETAAKQLASAESEVATLSAAKESAAKAHATAMAKSVGKLSPAQLEALKSERRDTEAQSRALRSRLVAAQQVVAAAEAKAVTATEAKVAAEGRLRTLRDLLEQLSDAQSGGGSQGRRASRGGASAAATAAARRSSAAAVDDTAAVVARLEAEVRDAEGRSRRRATALAEVKNEIENVENELSYARAAAADTAAAEKARVARARMRVEVGGYIGSISEVAEVPDRNSRYRVAAAAALGKHLHSVCVQTSGAAAECLKLLKQTAAGTMTFIPCDVAARRATPHDAAVDSLSHIARPVASVIETKAPAASAAVRYAVGNMLITESTEDAKSIAWSSEANAKRFPCVTLDGTIYHVNGSLQVCGLADLKQKAVAWDAAASEDKRELLKQKRASLIAQRDTLTAEAASDEVGGDGLSSLERRLANARAEHAMAATEARVLEERLRVAREGESEAERLAEEAAAKAEEEEEAVEKAKSAARKVEDSMRALQVSVLEKFLADRKISGVDAGELAEALDAAEESTQGHSASRRAAAHALAVASQRLKARKVAAERAAAASKVAAERVEEGEKALKAADDAVEAKGVDTAAKAARTEVEAATKAAADAALAVTRLREAQHKEGREVSRAVSEIAAARQGVSECDTKLGSMRALRAGVLTDARVHALTPPLLSSSLVPEDQRGVVVAESAGSGLRGGGGLPLRYGEPFEDSSAPGSGGDGTQSPRASPRKAEGGRRAAAAGSDSDSSDDGDVDMRPGRRRGSAAGGGAATREVCVDFTGLQLNSDLVAASSDVDKPAYAAACAQFMKTIRSAEAELAAHAANPRAAAAYDALTARLTELEQQGEELQSETSESHAAFVKATRSRKEAFMTYFDQLQTATSDAYSALTAGAHGAAGGTAHLQLDSLDTPWAGGCTYVANPPNKPMTSIASLSGGEKMVAALALVFGMYTVSRSPFLILDEVDANLDQTLVGHLARYILTHQDFQTLVISHVPRLYEEADSLVGVSVDPRTASSGVLTLDLAAQAA